MKPEANAPSSRAGVEAFLWRAQHAVYTGGLDAETRYTVEAALKTMADEVQGADPRWDVLHTEGVHVRNTLAEAAHPAVVAALAELPWP